VLLPNRETEIHKYVVGHAKQPKEPDKATLTILAEKEGHKEIQ
jgi:hypothetical protein